MGEIPYKDMVKDNRTLAEFGPVDLGSEYMLKVRVKEFDLLDKDGNGYSRGPCISLQLFHGRRFLKAISIPNGKETELEQVIQRATNFILREQCKSL